MSCPDCFKGAIHNGKPTGAVTKLHGLNTYVAEPASGRPATGIVLIIPDAFGWDFVNIRLMADHYARKRDYRVYAPDFMDGQSATLWMINTIKQVEAKETWWDILSKPYHYLCLFYGLGCFAIPNRFGKSFPRIKSFMEAIRRHEAADLPVGAAGFCWGGKHVLLLGAEDEEKDSSDRPLMDAGFACHPSQLTFYDDIENLRLPVSFAVGDRDWQFPLEKAAVARSIVEAKPEGQKGELRVYDGYGHGFGCRVDSIKDDPKGADAAEDQALEWFDKHFAKANRS
ncbi:Alpha/Beta hydrolase protein [Xylariales sp. PMI_506]|nr:Alpha/Beta hydrolase protein [Xylariales sp. PMI_506]